MKVLKKVLSSTINARILTARAAFIRIAASILLSSLFGAPSAWAEQENAPRKSDSVSCGNTIDVDVNGLVCDFCARALEKTFGKRDEVTNIVVDLDNAKVTVTLKDEQVMDDVMLTKLITDSGYNVVAIKRCDS